MHTAKNTCIKLKTHHSHSIYMLNNKLHCMLRVDVYFM